MAGRLQLKDQKFNKLLVLDFAYMKNKRSYWKCICDCGTKVTAVGYRMKNGYIKSCGCAKKEVNKGYKHTLEARKNMSEAQKGEKSYWYGRKHSVESIKKMGIAQKNSKNNAFKRKGEKHHNYNSNITNEERKDRRDSSINKEWAKCVYKLDNYTCQKCEIVGKNLNAHHIEAFNDNPELRIEVSNGITLCKNCHKDFHHQYGNHSTRAKLIKFLRS